MGYQIGGQTITVAQMMSAAGETTNSYDDVNVGRVEGAQAATTSTSQNQTGVVEGQTGVVEGQTGVVAGQQAKTTSEADSYVNYEGHVFQVPAGAIDTYNSENVFTGYTLSTGQVITVAQMMNAAQDTTTSINDVNVGRVEGA